MMDIADALQIVIDLARQNIINDDPDMEDQRRQQLEAIDVVEDMATNQFGDN